MTNKSFWDKYGKNSLMLALVTAVSALLTATVTYYWTRQNMEAQQRLEQERTLELKRIEFRNQSYTDFLVGQTLLHGGKPEDGKALIDSAKLRIIVLSSHEVLCAMSSYWLATNKYPECQDPEEKKKDADIYRNMRREVFKSMGSKESPEVEDSVLVPYLRYCSLPGESIDQACKKH